MGTEAVLQSGLMLQPPSGDVESSVPSLGGEWHPSSEMKSFLLSIQSSIEQVEEGVLTKDDFFFTVKHLIEDYMYVDCNMTMPSPHYEEVPEKNQLSPSYSYISVMPRFAKSTPSAILPRPFKHLPAEYEIPIPLSLPPRIPRQLPPTTRNRHYPPTQSSFVHPPSLKYDKQTNPSGSVPVKSFSVDQQLPSNVAPSPLAISPPLTRKNDCDDSESQQPLHDVSKEYSASTCSPTDSPCKQTYSFVLPVSDHGIRQPYTPGSMTKEDNHSNYRFSSSSSYGDYEVMISGTDMVAQPRDSQMPQDLELLPSSGLVRSASLDDVGMPSSINDMPTPRRPRTLPSSARSSDELSTQRKKHHPWLPTQYQRHPQLSTQYQVQPPHLDDIDTPSNIYDMPDSWLSTTMLSSARSTDELSTQRQERHPRLPTQYQVRHSRLPTQYQVRHSRLCSTSLDNLVDVVPLQTEEENTYSIPPDAVVGYVEPLFSQPMQSYFRFLQIANVNHNAKTIHMKGTLTVRSQRGSTRKRYFILHRLELQMHSLRGETRKASKSLLKTYHLDQWCQMRVGNAHNGFVLVIDEEELELIADSSLEHQHWVENISQALKSTCKSIAQKDQSKSTIQGPIYAVINGLTFKCSGAISDRHLKLYSSPEDDEPFYTLPLQGASMSKENEVTLPGCQMLYPKPVCDISSTVPPIHLHGNGFSLHLLFQDEQEYNTWHYYLCLDSDMECPQCRSPEEAILKLQSDAGGGESSSCDECKGIPLTSLPSEWKKAAVEMFKHIKVFMSTSLTSTVKSQPWQKGELSYFATSIQNIVDKCLKTRQLRNEFYCQIISLINKHSFENSMEALQGWLLLAITIPFFLPLKPRFLWYLEQHINKHLYSSFSQVVAFAVCCHTRLARAVQNKERMCSPAFSELLHQLSQFPDPPNNPIVHDVLLSTGSKVSISFDSSSTVQEVVSQINQELGLPSSHETGFSLACDWPGLEDAHVSLHPLEKMWDAVSAWNDNLASTGGLSSSSRHIQFVYCSRVFFQARAGREEGKEALFLIHQVNQEIVNSRLEVDLETAKELSALMLQVEQGNMSQYQSPLAVVKEALWKVFPMKETKRILDLDRRQNVDAILSLWKQLQNTSKEECIRLYLQRARRIPTFGYRHFQVKCPSPNGPSQTTIAVGEGGIQIISSSSSQQPVRDIPYHMVESFGSSGTGFMLYMNSRAVGVREKMTFGMPQVLVQELTLLIASYMEVFLKGINGKTSISCSPS